MNKVSQTLNASELLELLKQQWATTKDIKMIGRVGNNRSQLIKKEIVADLDSKGYKLPYGLVPMESVIDYFNININYLKKITGVKNEKN